MTRDPSGFSNISSTYQEAYRTYDGNVHVERVGSRLWKIVPRGGAAVFEKSKQEALERALQLAAAVTRRRGTNGRRGRVLPRSIARKKGR